MDALSPNQDSNNKDWVNTVASYKNYLADWNNDGNIDGKDLSKLCSTKNYTTSATIEKPWLPTITSNQTTISDTQDTKITLTFGNYGNMANTTLVGGEALDFDILDSNNDVVTGAVKGFAIEQATNKKVILTLRNDVDWSTGNDSYNVKHTMNKGGADAPALSFANNDPIYDFEASSFTLTDNLNPTVTITKTVGVEGGGDKIKDVPNIVFNFGRSIDNATFTKADITVKPTTLNLATATLTLNNDKDVATLSDIPALTDGTEYTFSVAADAFQSVSGVNNTASNDLKFTFDTTAPTIASGEVNADGDELILTMSENVVVTGDATARFTIGTQNPSSVTASGNKLTLTLGTAITLGERPNIAYDNTGDGGVVKDEAGNAMATRTAAAIDVANWTNNSTQTVVYNLTFGDEDGTNIFKYDGSNGKLTVEAWDGTISIGTVGMKFILDVPVGTDPVPANFTTLENDATTYNTYDPQSRTFDAGYFSTNTVSGLNVGFGGNLRRQIEFGGATTTPTGANFPSPPAVGEFLALISTAETGGTFWKPSKALLQNLWDNSNLKIILTSLDTLHLSNNSNSVTFKFVNISA